LAIRQLPGDPASRPSATAGITANTITLTVTRRMQRDVHGMADGRVADGGPLPAACTWLASGEEPRPPDGMLMGSLGATAVMIAAPAIPTPTPPR
jgi:hypothetical protein